jgi:ubiquinone/menaquinone biosynthesis C-methylase UbiE
MNVSFDEQVAAGYESWYQTTEGQRADKLEKAALRELLDGFSSAESILEVGCGTGHFTRWLHDVGGTAVGLDLSAPMLREAQARNGVPLVQGDAFRLPFADGAFDVTTLITTLEFLERPEAALAEAARVARRGVLLGVLNRWSPLALRRRLRGLFRPTIYDDARFYGPGALPERLRALADGDVRVTWHTTLLPGWARRPTPHPPSHLPWGGFIAIVLRRV